MDRKHGIKIFGVLVAGMVTGWATEPLSIDASFLQSLNEASEIAMHDKLNLDEIPSTVTVVRRDLIVDSGAVTLLDVLRLVPGICVGIGSSGKRKIVMRGVRSAYRDKLKLLINGVDVTNNLYNNQFYYYDFPAALIKRVEVTKTPDAVLYGSNAFLGVINVITLDEENKDMLYGSVSDRERYRGAVYKSVALGEGRLYLDAHAGHSEPTIRSMPTIRENLTTGEHTVFRDAMRGWTLEESLGIGAAYKRENLTLRYRYERYKKGSFFGISDVPPLQKDHDVTMTHQSAMVAYEDYWTPSWKWHLQAEGKDYRWDGSYRALPIDFYADTPGNNPDYDAILGAYVHEVQGSLSGYVRYQEGVHNLTLQMEGHYAKPVKMYYLQYVPAMGANQNPINLGPEGAHLTGANNVLKEGIDRKIFALAAEDLLAVSETLSVIAGVRYDHYNDFAGHPSYKLGMVWQVKKHDTLKWLFNHTFRAPSWIELYANAALEFHGNSDLSPETMDMGEVDWTHRFEGGDRLKVNLYYGKNRDTIQRCQKGYVNGDDLEISGVEGSWQATLGRWGNMEISAVYAHSERMIHEKEKKEGRFSFRGRLDASFWEKGRSFTMVEYHDGTDTETGGYIDPTVTVDEVITWRERGWVLQAGVRNLFDEKIYHRTHLSEPVSGPGGNIFRFYTEEGKTPTLGREWFVSLAWEW